MRPGALILMIFSLSSTAALTDPLASLPPNAPVAQVGDRVITAGELLRETGQRYGALAVSEMLFERFLEERCAEAGIVVAPDEVPPGRRREEVLFERLFADRAQPTDQEVEEFFRAQRELYRLVLVPAKGILLPTREDAEDLLRGALTEDNFGQWARDVSLHKSAPEGGELGQVSVKTFPDAPEVMDALLDPSESKIVGPVESPQGWWIFLREGPPVAGELPTLDDVRAQVVEDLRTSRLQALWQNRRLLVRRGLVRVALQVLWSATGEPPPPLLPSRTSGGAGPSGEAP